MNWQIAKLIKESTNRIEIDECVDFTEAVKKNPDIRRMSKIVVKGYGKIYPTKKYAEFHLTISGEMILGCALTLDDVPFPFEAEVNPVFVWDADKWDEDSEDYLVKDKIELASAIWQEIFVQIPLRVTKDGAYEELKAKGIVFLTEEELQKEQENKVDPRLEVLKGLKFD